MQAGLAQQNIVEPSPIQTAAVPVVLTGENVAIQSYTGSGKVSDVGWLKDTDTGTGECTTIASGKNSVQL